MSQGNAKSPARPSVTTRNVEPTVAMEHVALAKGAKSAAKGNAWWNVFRNVQTSPAGTMAAEESAGIAKRREHVSMELVSPDVYPTAPVKSAVTMDVEAYAPCSVNLRWSLSMTTLL